ncbi:MAG: phosphorylcholine transferase LicD [Aminipila sp.]
MIKINVEEGKQIQLELLGEFASFCEQNDLKYGLAYGTLLGAVREKGFIKWDYDIDVIMPRKDYVRFMQIYHNDRNVALCRNNNDSYDALVGIFGRKDAWRIPKWINLYTDKYLIGLDVYVVDCVPDGGWSLKIFIIKCKILLFLYKIKEVKITKERGVLTNLLLKIAKCLTIFINKKFIFKCFDHLISDSNKKYHQKSMIISDILNTKNKVFNKEVFSFDEKVIFEGRQYSAPREYKLWLKSVYGDYLKIPEKEQIEQEIKKAKEQFEWCRLEK